MTPPPEDRDHRVLHERLGAYVLGGLDAGERAEVDAHLAGCASCRAELATIAPLARPLRGVDPDASDGPAPAPLGLDDVLRRLQDEETGREETGRAEAPREVLPLAPRRRRPRVGLLVAAGALLIALAGLGAGYGLGLSDAAGPREPVAVESLAEGVQADAARIDHTWGVEVVLTARGFEPGRAYQVAVVDRSGRPVGAGAFVGTGTAEMECRLSSSVPPGEAAGFVVTTAPGVEVLRSSFT
ncbi:anti-sigma factor family protein [Actinomycetospora atypica]|uniref:Anti-sigma factor family protein n=1 Tax=Actinomycetospora atypica TaxID=1290095 RepID=A0ABV9YGS8_9PSEU